MHCNYLCCKNCFVETKQISKHFLNLMAKCFAILHHEVLNVVAKAS